MYPNRTLCQVLEEMRALDKSKNYGAMLGLIEEVQFLANRMEASLGYKNDIQKLIEKRSKLKKKLRSLEEKVKSLGGEEKETSGRFSTL